MECLKYIIRMNKKVKPWKLIAEIVRVRFEIMYSGYSLIFKGVWNRDVMLHTFKVSESSERKCLNKLVV